MQQLGIDIAKDKFDVALVIDANADPIRFKMKSFSNSIGGFAKLTDWIGAKASAQCTCAWRQQARIGNSWQSICATQGCW